MTDSGWLGSLLSGPLDPRIRLQRLIQNFRSSSPATQVYHRLESIDSEFDLPLRPLSGVLGANMQRPVGETGSDETIQLMNMVIQIPPGINNEIIMYEIEDTTSSNNNANEALNLKFKKKSLAAILLSKELALITLNFPNMDDLIEALPENSTSDDTQDGEADGQVAPDFAGNSCSVTKINAELKVFRSGRATLSLGSKVFVLAKAKSKGVHKVYLDMKDMKGRKRSMGFIKHYIDVLPEEETPKVETGEQELQVVR